MAPERQIKDIFARLALEGKVFTFTGMSVITFLSRLDSQCRGIMSGFIQMTQKQEYNYIPEYKKS